MPWRVGAWWPQEDTDSSPPAYTQAPHKGYSRVLTLGGGTVGAAGVLTGFSVEGGRAAGEIEYRGMTMRATIEGWDFSVASGPPYVGQPFAMRWDTGSDADAIADDAVRWPKGPPCVFAGWVVSYNTRHLIGADGRAHTVTEVVADDWLGEWAYLRPWNQAGQPALADLEGAAAGWLFRTPGIRRYVEGVRLGTLDNVAVADDDVSTWQELTSGDAIRQVEAATATEMFVRHGERLGTIDPGDGTVSVPPTETATGLRRRANQWYIRSPQLVIRKVSGDHHWTTFDAPHVLVTEDDESERSSTSAVVAGAPIGKRYRPGSRPYEIEVVYPPPLDRVTLSGAGLSVTRSASLGGWERSTMERPGLPVENQSAFQTQLEQNAQNFLDANTNFYKIYRVTIRSLTDDEITEWAPIGFADEVVLDPPDSTVLPNIAEVRFVRWESSAVTGTNLVLELTPVHDPIADPLDPAPPVVPPAQVPIWTANMTWRAGDQAHSGYDHLLYGAIDDDDFFVGSDEVRILNLSRRRSGRMRIEVETAAQLDLIEGKFVQLELATGTVTWAIPPGAGSSATTTQIVIPDENVPASGLTVVAHIYDTDPT